MKKYEYKTRNDYISEQIRRSRAKNTYCKVFFSDAIRYRQLLLMDRGKEERFPFDPILCLGVRNGAEINLFRSVFYGPLLKLPIVQSWAINHDITKSGREKIRLARYLGIGSGDSTDGKVIGVELNPEARRSDIWIGSFDQMPTEWTGRFKLLYSNSFDHSEDPERTVSEWRRVAAPGAYVILAFSEDSEASYHDPLGGIGFSEMINLWKAPIVFSTETSNAVGYKEICFRLN